MKIISSLGRRGQILPGAVAMLVILAVMVPSIVLWIQRETVFASKQSHNTVAFHLAEAGVEKAYLYISLSTTTWVSIQNGNAQPNYAFDKQYQDIAGGTYAISITSGPGTEQVTIVTVGRDKYNKETRALRVSSRPAPGPGDHGSTACPRRVRGQARPSVRPRTWLMPATLSRP